MEFNFYAYLVASYPGHPLKNLGMRLGRCADWRMMSQYTCDVVFSIFIYIGIGQNDREFTG